MPQTLCSLEYAAGRLELCDSSCVFWEHGGAVVDAGCLLERLLPREDWTPELAERWLYARRTLAASPPGARLYELLGRESPG